MLNTIIFWRHPPYRVVLTNQEAHIWCANLDVPGDQLQHLRETLTESEISRAEAFKHQKDSQRFIAARGLLRRILSRYLGVPPGQLEIKQDCMGKPFVLGDGEPVELQFNVSHSEGLAVYGITKKHPIGVDLERMSDELDFLSLGSHFLSKKELETMKGLPPSQVSEAFYTCWTRKEAFLKATGEGLSKSPDQVEVSMAPDEPARVLQIDGDVKDTRSWMIHTIHPAHGFIGAVAIRQRGMRLACWQWSDTAFPQIQLPAPSILCIG